MILNVIPLCNVTVDYVQLPSIFVNLIIFLCRLKILAPILAAVNGDSHIVSSAKMTLFVGRSLTGSANGANQAHEKVVGVAAINGYDLFCTPRCRGLALVLRGGK